jgi:sporulation protein YlmC with PRC-barrel domain
MTMPQSRFRGLQHLILLFSAVAAMAVAVVPRSARAEALVVVDVVSVAEGYRASKLRGTNVVTSQNEKVGELDDLVVGKTDRVLFAIIQVGGFLGIGSYLIAVPYTSLQISDNGKRIVLPGATKESVKALPEFKYR